jgi:hypothetical protein
MIVLILARNEGVSRSGITAGLKFVQSTFPIPCEADSARAQEDEEEPMIWSNDVFLESLGRLSSEDVSATRRCLTEILIPYGRMAANMNKYYMHVWDLKVAGSRRGVIAADRFPEQYKTLARTKNNLAELRRHAREPMLERYGTMLQTLETTFHDAELQVGGLQTEMAYRASVASLEDSRKSIEFAEKGIIYTQEALAQNDRVKRLTQLAFIFIPLSTVTSVFGMNLEVLNAGPAQIWMVVVAVVVAYVSVLSLWGVLTLNPLDWAKRSIRATRFALTDLS